MVDKAKVEDLKKLEYIAGYCERCKHPLIVGDSAMYNRETGKVLHVSSKACKEAEKRSAEYDKALMAGIGIEYPFEEVKEEEVPAEEAVAVVAEDAKPEAAKTEEKKRRWPLPPAKKE